MTTCKDCAHVEVCGKCIMWQKFPELCNVENLATCCDFFTDRSRFVELSCKVGDIVTTIDEAIDHCYQIATSTDETVCAECKAEHMRLCGWLGDLKRRIATEQALNERENNE